MTRLVHRRCDGTTVRRYRYPKSISVELCVRPSDFEPCVQIDAIERGYHELGELLQSRIAEDAALFGVRSARSLTAKWKTFGNKAKQVAQRSMQLSGEASSLGSKEFGSKSLQLFSEAHPRAMPFSVSRLVVVLHYKANTSRTHRTAGTHRGVKRKCGQTSITSMFNKAD